MQSQRFYGPGTAIRPHAQDASVKAAAQAFGEIVNSTTEQGGSVNVRPCSV